MKRLLYFAFGILIASVYALQGINITFIGHFKKGTKEVAIFGIANHPYSSKVCFQEEDVQQRNLFLQFLTKCNVRPFPVTCLFLDPHSIVLAEKEKTEAFKASLYAHLHQKLHNNIQYIHAPITTSTDCHLLALTRFFSSTTLSSVIGTIPTSFPDKKRFFSKKGPWGKLQDHLTTVYGQSKTCYQEYLAEHDALLTHIVSFIHSLTNEKIKVALTTFIQHLETQKKSLESFFTLYNHGDTKASLISILLNSIQSHHSFEKALNLWNKELISFITNRMTLLALIAFTKILEKNDALFCVIHQELSTPLKNFFTLLGFKEHSTNMVSSVASTDSRPSKISNPHCNIAIEVTLQDIFALPGEIPNIYEHVSSADASLLKQLTQLLQNASQPALSKHQETTLLLQPHTGRLKPLDREQIILDECCICKQPLQPQLSYLVTTNKTAYCSAHCFVRDFIIKQKATHPLLTLLLSEAPLQPEDKSIVERLALLCYYQYVLLLPSTGTDQGLFYSYNHIQLSTLLDKLIKAKNTAFKELVEGTAWQKALDLAKVLGDISFEKIKAFSKLLGNFKESYLTALLKQVAKTPYDKLSESDSPLFDPGNILKRSQKSIVEYFIKLTDCPATTTPDKACQFYLALYNLTLKRLGSSLPLLPTLLHYKEAPLNEEVLKTFAPRTLPARKIPPLRHKAKNVSQKLPSRQVFIPYGILEELPSMVPVKKQELLPTATIYGHFAAVPYQITLYNAKRFFVAQEQRYKETQQCSIFPKAYRIKILSALYEQIQAKPDLEYSYNTFNALALTHPLLAAYDISISEKVDIHHLFDSQVEQYLTQFGLLEDVDDCIQISIPGEISYEDDTFEVGFFQYTFNKKLQKCIHQCFKPFMSNTTINKQYLSNALRKALYAFLKEYMKDQQEYESVMHDIEVLIV